MPRRRRSRWRFVWSEESTKRGALRILSGICALIGLRYGADVAAAILAIGEGLIGIFGALRSDADDT